MASQVSAALRHGFTPALTQTGMAILFAILQSTPADARHSIDAALWEVVEIRMSCEDVPSEPFSVVCGASFESSTGNSMQVPGFYDGGNTWTVRFCPPEPGNWSYESYSAIESLTGHTGIIKVSRDSHNGHPGPIEISKTNRQRFMYADGTPYFLMAFECDWLFALDAENPYEIPLTREIVSHIKDNGFNKVVMNVYAYDAPWGEKGKINPANNYAKPKVFPFLGTNDDPDYNSLNIKFFQRFDRVMEHLNNEGIVSHLMIYVWNKKVAWPEPESRADNLYFDYVAKRYQAYPNLIWDISKEALAYGRNDMNYITRRIARLRKLDAHQRLVTVHDYDYCGACPGKVDFISIQDWQPHLIPRMREIVEQYPDKPIFNIEHGGYEKTAHHIFNGAYTDPKVCLDRAYQCVFGGSYFTYYWQNASWYNVVADPFALPEAQQPHFRYYKHLMEFFEKYNYNDLMPFQRPGTPPFLSNEKDTYIFYLANSRRGLYGSIKELKGKTCNVTWYDPLTGNTHEAGKKMTRSGWLGVHKPENAISGSTALCVLTVAEPPE